MPLCHEAAGREPHAGWRCSRPLGSLREDRILANAAHPADVADWAGQSGEHEMVVLENVSKSYGERIALGPTSITFETQRVSALIGASGCGKSTLLRLIIGLAAPDTGRVTIGGEPVTDATVTRLRRQVGYVIQEGGLFPHLTAGENVALLPRFLRRDSAWIARRVAALADLARLPAAAMKRYPRELSGGQRQRVGIMRALVLDPPLLLLDEPLGALDPVTRGELQEELKALFADLRKTVILVTHDMHEAAWLSDDLVLMREGRILQRGGIAELLERPADPYVGQFIRAQRSGFAELPAAHGAP